MPQAAPGRIIRQNRCDLREREDEDEVEEELERRDALLALDVLLAHRRTLARTERDRRQTTTSGRGYPVCASDRKWLVTAR